MRTSPRNEVVIRLDADEAQFCAEYLKLNASSDVKQVVEPVLSALVCRLETGAPFTVVRPARGTATAGLLRWSLSPLLRLRMARLLTHYEGVRIVDLCRAALHPQTYVACQHRLELEACYKTETHGDPTLLSDATLQLWTKSRLNGGGQDATISILFGIVQSLETRLGHIERTSTPPLEKKFGVPKASEISRMRKPKLLELLGSEHQQLSISALRVLAARKLGYNS